MDVRMKYFSGHTITRFEEKELDEFRKEFPAEQNYIGFQTVNPGNITVPPYFDQVANKIHQFRFRESDVIVNTTCKAGTTWVQEIIWTMKNNPNLDNPSASLPQGDRSPLLELDAYTGTEGPYFESLLNQVKLVNDNIKEKDGIFLRFLETFNNPRIIKTHLPICLLPPDTLDRAKLVYVARNPYDVCISYYHFSRLLKEMSYSGTFEQFVQRFMEGKHIALPFWEHVYEAWEKRSHPNLHFIFYEDLKKDPFTEIVKLNTFLKTGLTEEQIKNVMEFTRFSSMKARGVVAFGVVETKDHMHMDLKEKVGGFLRKGIVGDWKNCNNTDIIDQMKTWIDDKMKIMEIPFIYDIN